MKAGKHGIVVSVGLLAAVYAFALTFAPGSSASPRSPTSVQLPWWSTDTELSAALAPPGMRQAGHRPTAGGARQRGADTMPAVSACPSGSAMALPATDPHRIAYGVMPVPHSGTGMAGRARNGLPVTLF